MQLLAPDAPPIITLAEVSRSFRAGLGTCLADARALDRVSLLVRQREIVLLTGRRGAGKTALLHCLAGVMLPDSGQISWGGVSRPPEWIALATARDLRQAAPTVDESIEEAIGGGTHSVWEIDALVTRAMSCAGLCCPRATKVATLAVGDRTRLRISRAIARTLARCHEIRCLLIDGSAEGEPLALVGDELHRISTRLGAAAVIAAANSLGVEGCFVPRTLVLEHGRLIADIKRVAPPTTVRASVKAQHSPTLADVDPLPALL